MLMSLATFLVGWLCSRFVIEDRKRQQQCHIHVDE
jgi:hypothetical protein